MNHADREGCLTFSGGQKENKAERKAVHG